MGKLESGWENCASQGFATIEHIPEYSPTPLEHGRPQTAATTIEGIIADLVQCGGEINDNQ